MKNFCVALSDDLAAWVEATAKAEDRSSGSVIRRALLTLIATQIPSSEVMPVASDAAAGREAAGKYPGGPETPSRDTVARRLSASAGRRLSPSHSLEA